MGEGEVLRVEPHEWDQCPYNRDPESACPFRGMRTQREGSAPGTEGAGTMTSDVRP